jgi:hypothetical protein
VNAALRLPEAGWAGWPAVPKAKQTSVGCGILGKRHNYQEHDQVGGGVTAHGFIGVTYPSSFSLR